MRNAKTHKLKQSLKSKSWCFPMIGMLAITGLVTVNLRRLPSSANDGVVSTITVTVQPACTLSSSEPSSSSTTTLMNNMYYPDIYNVNLTSTCNDLYDSSIYAVGYTGCDSDNEETCAKSTNVDSNGINNNTKLLNISADSSSSSSSSSSSTTPFITGLTPFPANGETDLSKFTTSGWYMKVTPDSSNTWPFVAQNNFNNFHTIPTDSTLIAKTTITSNSDPTPSSTTNIAYSAYIDGSQAAGSYQGKVKYTLVTTTSTMAPTLTVNFDSNVDNVIVKTGSPAGATLATVTTSGTTLDTITADTSYYLLPIYKQNYTFNSATKDDNAVGTLSAGDYGYYYYTTTSGTNSVTLSSKSITNSGTMQNLSASTCTAAPTNVTDNRDNNVYQIQRLADGKCWMLDNLRLDTSTASMTTSNTNMKSETSATTTNGSIYSYNTVQINIANKDKTTTSYGSGSGKIGVYYNYCAASAGTYCMSSSSGSGNAQYDVCPKGWRMPTGGSSGEYQTLYAAYNSDTTNFRNALSTPLSGCFYEDSQDDLGSRGYFWSSTYYRTTSMYYLIVYPSNVNPQDQTSRNLGFSVRCVLE